MEENSRIDMLIVRKLTGELTQEECDELNDFVSASEHNRKYVETYERLWHESNKSLFHKINEKEDWKNVRSRMGFNHRRITSTRRQFMRIAAVLIPALIILAAVSAYYFVPGFGRLTAYDATSKDIITLPDGSEVTLKSGSSLTVVRGLKGEKRRVKLKGEAFFDIAKDHTHPFVISVASVTVEVLGTAFNLEKNGQEVRIDVVRGVVRFSGKHEEVLVHKGEEAVFDGNTIHKTDIRDENFLAWKTGVMKFKDAGLKDILEVITDTYDEVKGYKINSPADVKVTTEFVNQPLKTVLNELQIHFNKKFVLHEGILVISD